MAEYTDDLALIVRYDGSKSAFDALTDKSAYYGRVVFITGTTSKGITKGQAIWVSETGSTSGKYLDMSNIDTLKSELEHITKIYVDGTSYDGKGGVAYNFVGADGIGVTISQANGQAVITFSGADLKTAIVGTSPNNSNTNSYPDTITGAKAYTDKVAGDLKGTKATGDTTAETIRGAKDYADAKISDAKTELKGTKATGDTTAETIRGAKDYADNVAASKASAAKDEAIQESKDYVSPLLNNKADLENGKIKEGQLPDYIFGQMLFGGTITAGGANTMEVSPSSKLLDKVDKPSTTSSLTIKNTEASTYEGAYFIVTGGLTSIFGFSVVVGDWIVSTGQDWRKVDNTDAVSSVAELTGVITASALAKKLAETNDTNELALKSEVDEKYSLPYEGVPESDLSQGVQTKLNRTVNIGEGDYIDVKEVTEGNKLTNEISAKTKTIEQAESDSLLGETNTNALATADDVYAFIKARLSIKIVSPQ